MPTWESSANSDVQDSLGLGLDEQKVRAFAASKFGARELRSLIFKGGGLITLAKISQLIARRLSGKVLLEAANYQIRKEVVKKVKGSSGNQIQDSHDKISEKFQCMAHHKGFHRFCFTNKSPYHEIIDFDVHVGHFAYYDHHAKDEHINPLLEQIGKLEEALSNIQFEQHWLEAQTEHQAIGKIFYVKSSCYSNLVSS
ncbi:uncharacterized protein LOC130136604 [Syzygium oleosum]|uniref:uncharacterized protein LOC130136604 n=1 Tax=Syzygium oleosum TaxID=219896 RepID=UPI0024B9F822|nr:uncharacterized protein LOC130136604 [Syzygium oleosum]XP_056162685.1 uncharacterized protein LOC130136604 [Syzygium oleosum]XP_056162686.1 uncharacterized protein LOC130136604 [Syzygium oleosum]